MSYSCLCKSILRLFRPCQMLWHKSFQAKQGGNKKSSKSQVFSSLTWSKQWGEILSEWNKNLSPKDDLLEPSCCKNRQEMSQPINWFGDLGTSDFSEWYQIGPKWAWVTPLIIKDQFCIIQNLHMSPIPQTSFLVGTFFAASCSKTALVPISNHSVS